jgi:cytochrome c-type biogenesis protein CcmH/NrfF
MYLAQSGLADAAIGLAVVLVFTVPVALIMATVWLCHVMIRRSNERHQRRLARRANS